MQPTMMKMTVVTLMLVTLVQLNGVEAIKCYVCAVCSGDSFGSEVSCPSSNLCLKTYTAYSGSSVTTRSCGIGQSTSKCESRSDSGATVTVCSCNTDLCNSADNLHGIGQHQMTLCALSVGVSLILAFFTR